MKITTKMTGKKKKGLLSKVEVSYRKVGVWIIKPRTVKKRYRILMSNNRRICIFVPMFHSSNGAVLN
jgi:hypothetical protein